MRKSSSSSGSIDGQFKKVAWSWSWERCCQIPPFVPEAQLCKHNPPQHTAFQISNKCIYHPVGVAAAVKTCCSFVVSHFTALHFTWPYLAFG
jgi:hypothetical protein